MCALGLVRHIRRQTFGRSESRPLSDQKHRDGWPEQFANLIEYSHPAMANHKYLAERPIASLGSVPQSGQQRWDLGEDCSDREPVSDRDLQIISWRATLQQL